MSKLSARALVFVFALLLAVVPALAERLAVALLYGPPTITFYRATTIGLVTWVSTSLRGKVRQCMRLIQASSLWLRAVITTDTATLSRSTTAMAIPLYMLT